MVVKRTSQPFAMNEWNNLPRELWALICTFLSFRDRIAYRQISKYHAYNTFMYPLLFKRVKIRNTTLSEDSNIDEQTFLYHILGVTTFLNIETRVPYNPTTLEAVLKKLYCNRMSCLQLELSAEGFKYLMEDDQVFDMVLKLSKNCLLKFCIYGFKFPLIGIDSVLPGLNKSVIYANCMFNYMHELKGSFTKLLDGNDVQIKARMRKVKDSERINYILFKGQSRGHIIVQTGVHCDKLFVEFRCMPSA